MDVPRIFKSSKFQAAFLLTTIQTAMLIFTLTDKNLDRPHKQEATIAFIKWAGIVWGAAIGATGLEDAAEKHGNSSNPPAPQVQVNTAGADQQVNSTGPAPTVAPAPLVSRPPTIPQKVNPMLHKLPLLALCLLPLVAGCQTAPELTTYREGLHAVDEPLYQAHLKLLDDAVKAGVRSPVDKQTVQAGVDAAESLYNQSKKTEAAGVGK